METEIQYAIFKEESINYNSRVRSEIIHRGSFTKEKVVEFKEFVASILGFYYCTSEYFQDHYISSTKIKTRPFGPEGMDYYLYTRRKTNTNLIYYIRHISLPFVAVHDPEVFLRNEEFNDIPYLKIWPLLITIYCLNKKDNHKIFLLI